jgi:hypothetical protein
VVVVFDESNKNPEAQVEQPAAVAGVGQVAHPDEQFFLILNIFYFFYIII